jgi:hypothetical protein
MVGRWAAAAQVGFGSHPEMIIASTSSPLRPDFGRIAASQRASALGQKRTGGRTKEIAD